MKAAKDRYKKEIEKEREKSWSKFVENDLGSNLWGVAYKLASEKFNKMGVMAVFREEEVTCLTKSEAANFLVNKLLPDDNLDLEYAIRKIWRHDFVALEHVYTNEIEEVIEEELR